MSRRCCVTYLVMSLVFVLGYASPARALSVNVGDLTITDNDPLFDRDPRVGIITFDLFVMLQGYQIAGTATQFSNGTFTQLANFAQVALDVTATRPGNVGNGARLVLSVESTFAGNFSPPSPIAGVDLVRGNFVSVLNNNLGGGNNIAERGFVNDTFIDPLMSTGRNEPFDFTPPANVPGQFFGPDGHGPKQFALDIRNVSTLMGRAAFNLGAFDRLNFSMQVLTTAVSEPSTLMLLVSGGLILLARLRR